MAENIKTIIQSINAHTEKGSDAAKGGTFECATEYRLAGIGYRKVIDLEVAAWDKLEDKGGKRKPSKNSVYDEHGKAFKLGKTAMTSQVFPLGDITEADLKKVWNAYVKHGYTNHGSDTATTTININGIAKCVDYFNQGCYNLETGKMDKLPAAGGRPSKTPAAKRKDARDKANEKFTEAAAKVSALSEGNAFDWRYFTKAQLEAMKVSLIAELTAREAGVKALSKK